MITECYIKGWFDYGVGKCAVMIKEGDETVHQVAWKTPDTWQYGGETVQADQQNCEILAATYAMQWCMNNHKSLVNIYANTTTAQKWYLREDFPESRITMAKAYCQAVEDYYGSQDVYEGQPVRDRIYADVIHKDYPNEWKQLVNRLAEQVK